MMYKIIDRNNGKIVYITNSLATAENFVHWNQDRNLDIIEG